MKYVTSYNTWLAGPLAFKTVCKVWAKYIMVQSETLIQTSKHFRGVGEEGGGENTRNYIFYVKKEESRRFTHPAGGNI
jgi:hypothetical protein